MLILHNAYNILGLPIDADDKLINKRYKEILNLLKINELPSYSTDLNKCDYSELRTAQGVDKAYANLTNLTKKLQEQFFWFDFYNDEVSENFVHILDDKEGLWENSFNGSRKLSDTKNRLLGKILKLEYCGALRKKHKLGIDYSELMKDLKSLLGNQKFWSEFVKIRSLYSGIEVREDIIDSLRNNVPLLLAEHFFDLSEYISDSKLYASFVKVFNIQAKELDDNESVSESLKSIQEKLASTEDLDLVNDLDEIIDNINYISKEIDKLDKQGLTDNSKITHIKDHFATCVRGMAVDLFNKHNDPDNASNFLQEALNIGYSTSLKHKIEGDIDVLNERIQEIDELQKKESAMLQAPVALKDLEISVGTVKDLVRKGGRFVVYQHCVSLIFFTKKTPTEIYFIPPGVSGFSEAIGPTLITLIFGWWGFPFGPIYSLECIFSNLFGGKDITKEIVSKL